MKIIKINKRNILALALLLGSPSAAFAGSNSGIYLGVGAGTAMVEASGTDASVGGSYDFNQSDTANKFFGGYNFGLIPFIDLAVEASVNNFGKQSTTQGGNPLNYEITGISTFGLAGMNFGPFGFFAKAGAINWESKATIGTTNTSKTGTDAAFGIGARFAISALSVRAEYEEFSVSDVNKLTMVSISGIFTF